jgi:hypothetical protein
MLIRAACIRISACTGENMSLQALIVKFLGFLIASVLFVLTVPLDIIRKGWDKVFYLDENRSRPQLLDDPRWGKHKFALLPDLRMHYVEKGDRSKPLMIFVHGFPEFWFSWRHQVQYFSKDYW